LGASRQLTKRSGNYKEQEPICEELDSKDLLVNERLEYWEVLPFVHSRPSMMEKMWVEHFYHFGYLISPPSANLQLKVLIRVFTT
jgi:hypothetical protein